MILSICLKILEPRHGISQIILLALTLMGNIRIFETLAFSRGQLTFFVKLM